MPVGPGLLPPSTRCSSRQFVHRVQPCPAWWHPVRGSSCCQSAFLVYFFDCHTLTHTHTDTGTRTHTVIHIWETVAAYDNCRLHCVRGVCAGTWHSPPLVSPCFRLFVVVVALPFCCFFRLFAFSVLSFFGLFGRSLTLSMSLLPLQLSFFIRLRRFLFLFTLPFFVAVFCFYFYYFYLIAFSHVAVVVAVGGAYHFRCCLNCFTDFLLLSLSFSTCGAFFIFHRFFGIFMMFTL